MNVAAPHRSPSPAAAFRIVTATFLAVVMIVALSSSRAAAQGSFSFGCGGTGDFGYPVCDGFCYSGPGGILGPLECVSNGSCCGCQTPGGMGPIFFQPTCASCGNGIIESPEACDEAGANGSVTSCCKVDCTVRAAGEVCRLAAGVCDLEDVCSGQPYEGCENAKRTDECRPAAGVCDVAETCNGVSSACPSDDAQPNGTPCDDADACTANEQCTNGACTGEPACPTPTPTPTGCAAGPQAGCRNTFVPRSAQLTLKRDLVESKEKVGWSWRRGAATSTSDFGQPLTTTSYELCLYDGNDQLLFTAHAPAGGLCLGKPCWETTPHGFRYSDKNLSPDGVLRLDLAAGADGKAKISLKGKGANLAMPTLPVATLPVTVQLRSSDGACFGATYGVPAKNAADGLKAKSD